MAVISLQLSFICMGENGLHHLLSTMYSAVTYFRITKREAEDGAKVDRVLATMHEGPIHTTASHK